MSGDGVVAHNPVSYTHLDVYKRQVEHSVACITAIDTARAMLTVRTQGRAAELRPIDITEI